MLVRGTLVHCPTLGELEILEDHLLVVNTEGFITHIGPASSVESTQILLGEHDRGSLVDIPEGSFLLPTFCDLHLHAPQMLYQGTGLHLPLMQWLDEYAFKAEEKLDADLALAKSVYERLAQRLIEHGTGAVLLFGTIKEETNLILASAMQSAGLRACVGKLSMDTSSRPTYVEPSARASLASARSFVHRCRALAAAPQQLVQPVVTPRFVPTCSGELLKGLGELAREEDVMVQSHMCEAREQVEWVRRVWGEGDVGVFDKSGLLTRRTVQAHCTFLPSSAFPALAEKGVAIAHCPLSNAYFSEEPFKLREALGAGVKVGLGSDIAGGYSIDIMQAMRQAVVVSRMREGAEKMMNEGEGEMKRVDWMETLYLATRGGAEALGLRGGAFVVGAPFDTQQIRIYDPASGAGVGALDFFSESGGKIDLGLLEKWWCLGDVRNRVGMWVQGRKLQTIA